MSKHITKLLVCLLGVCVTITSIYVGYASEIVPAADVDQGRFSDPNSGTALLAISEYGLVSFIYDTEYSERYTLQNSDVTLYEREGTWDVTPSRSDSGAYALISLSAKHYASNGSLVNDLTMTPDTVEDYNTLNGSVHGYESVTYDCTEGYYGTTSFSIAAPGMVYPYIDEDYRINFDLDPLR